MDDLHDVQQFVGVNKITFQLKYHPRFHDVIENAQPKLENPDPTGQGARLECVNGLLRKAVALIDREYLCISLNEVMKKGIHSLSVKFDKSNLWGCIGIVKAYYKIPYPCLPGKKSNEQSMLIYWGYDGYIRFKGKETFGNLRFSDYQILTMELNMDAGTLHFFVDGVQQPVFVKGINEPV
ncbi:MAG: hypothetical protein EZS28_052004, partial [Streblomastix strix]